MISSQYVDCCELCAQNSKRIFSVFGNDKRFPRLPIYLLQSLPQHEFCYLSFNHYVHDFCLSEWDFDGNLIDFCNRPFRDERSPEDVERFESRKRAKTQEKLDRQMYYLIYEKCPDIAPKSLGGFRGMKRKNSPNFKKLMTEVKNRLKGELTDIPNIYD